MDLGDLASHASYHTAGLDLASKAVLHEDSTYARVHVTILPSARRAIVASTGLPAYAVEDPTALPEDLRTPAWTALCEQLRHYRHLDSRAKLRVLWLLHQMTLHSAVLTYGQPPAAEADDAPLDTDTGALLYVRGLAKVSLFRDGAAPLDLTELLRTEALAPIGSWAHTESTYLLAQVALKSFGDLSAFERHLAHHKRSIDAADVSQHGRSMLASRYHRILAMQPQLQGDFTGMSEQMDLAQHHCSQMLSRNRNEEIEKAVLQAAVTESRIKECLVLGDLDAAEKYAGELVTQNPTEPRARLEQGQVLVEKGDFRGAADAYAWASLLGPHTASVAEFMRGQCLEAEGRSQDAHLSYLRSVAADPLAISAVQRLHDGELAAGNVGFRAWTERRLSALREMESNQAPVDDDLQAYQMYGRVLG